MLNGIADFGKELDYGKKREQDFIKYMNGIVLRSSDGVIEDFMLFNGEKIELKSERYIHCDYNDFPNYKSKNFCIEIYSDKLSKKLGGPLRAEKDNIKYFCQFMGDDTLWVFETKNICKFIYDNILMGTDVITEIGNLKNIKNKNWTTLTWVFDRNLIKPIAKHIIKLEEGKNYKYLFDNTKEKTKEYNNFLILDTETTGLKKYYHEPVQIYGMFERKQKIQDKFNFYCQPRYWDRIEKIALEVNKLTIDKLKTFEDPNITCNKLIEKLKENFNGDKFILVGANPSYDFHMLRGFFKFANKLEEFDKYFEYLVIDVLDQGRLLKKEGKVENAKLVTVASYYKVPLENAHDAKYDCECTYELFKMFRKELKIKEEKS
jgi:DNA polymerase III epsilon subunit-like protein